MVKPEEKVLTKQNEKITWSSSSAIFTANQSISATHSLPPSLTHRPRSNGKNRCNGSHLSTKKFLQRFQLNVRQILPIRKYASPQRCESNKRHTVVGNFNTRGEEASPTKRFPQNCEDSDRAAWRHSTFLARASSHLWGSRRGRGGRTWRSPTGNIHGPENKISYELYWQMDFSFILLYQTFRNMLRHDSSTPYHLARIYI